jgi:hypothetical protein
LGWGGAVLFALLFLSRDVHWVARKGRAWGWAPLLLVFTPVWLLWLLLPCLILALALVLVLFFVLIFVLLVRLELVKDVSVECYAFVGMDPAAAAAVASTA